MSFTTIIKSNSNIHCTFPSALPPQYGPTSPRLGLAWGDPTFHESPAPSWLGPWPRGSCDHSLEMAEKSEEKIASFHLVNWCFELDFGEQCSAIPVLGINWQWSLLLHVITKLLLVYFATYYY